VLELRGITKRFGPLVANDAIDLQLAAGEVLALLGENGAGKSTLVSILFGHYTADAGEIRVHCERLPPGDPRAALAAGVGMVHQHFTLADNLSVLDNVMLGTEPLWRPASARRAARAKLVATAERLGLAVNPEARVATLSVGERQRVEILKALTRGASILILDEPTAVLTPQEVASLFATLRRLVAEGLAIIFISHKLDEVLAISRRVAVLRGGKLVAMRDVPRATPDAPATGQDAAAGARTTSPLAAELAELMVGRRVELPTRGSSTSRGAPCLVLQGVSVQARDAAAARPRLDNVSLSVHAGDIVAIAGVSGNGQQALAELCFGLASPSAGMLTLNGAALPARPRAWVDAGVARVPEDRHAVGAVSDLSVWENAVLERYAEPPVARFGLLRRDVAMAHARHLVERFDVRGTEGLGLATPVRRLSGGNLQKLILGRALMGAVQAPGSEATQPGPRAADHAPHSSRPDAGPAATSAALPGPGISRGAGAPRLIVADQPTWGLDVGAVAYVHQQLLDACAAGAAVLLISEDLDEIRSLADHIAVMHHGQLTTARRTADWTLAELGLAMAGQSRTHDAHHAGAVSADASQATNS
jgi:simple sugar transport system ATP-binding protein